MSNHAFVDSSSNNWAITRVNTPTQCSVTPYAPAAGVEYVAATNGGSCYFNGINDHMTIPFTSSAFSPRTGDFTFECWVYPMNLTSGVAMTVFGNTGCMFRLVNDGTGRYMAMTSQSTGYTDTGYNITSDTWQHVAFSRVGTTLKVFVNGVMVRNITNSSDINLGTGTTPLYVGRHENGIEYFKGFVTGIRIINGTGLYTAAFTPATTPYTAVTNTKLLLNFLTADVFDSRCLSPSITIGGIVTDISLFKYGNASINFDGVSGTWMVVPGSSNVWMGTGDFTIETWIYPTLITGVNRGIFGINSLANISNGFIMAINATNNKLGIRIAGSSWGALESTSSISLNTWTHVAMVRTGGNVKVYINGVQEITTTTGGSTNFTAGDFAIGRSHSNVDEPFKGNMDDFRVTKGLARYTGNFTPPSALPKK